MATAELHPAFISFRGNIGRLVWYQRMGTPCVRSHVIPYNPRTEAQQLNRNIFAEAVKTWQSMSDEERYTWKTKGAKRNRTGYNYFISEYMKRSAQPAGSETMNAPSVSAVLNRDAQHISLHTGSVSSPLIPVSPPFKQGFTRKLICLRL